MSATPRRRRANGEASKEKILDAATRIASERGYEGTSIGLVSKQCGLPASSIYWHFADKDDLIAAVIERSFSTWLDAWSLPVQGDAPERVVEMARQVAAALRDSPDFLRLGLMLTLERRPVEPKAREMFLRVRAEAFETLRTAASDLAPGIDPTAAERLATYAMAGADGLFIAAEVDGDVDLPAMFELHARALAAIAAELADPSSDDGTDSRRGHS